MVLDALVEGSSQSLCSLIWLYLLPSLLVSHQERETHLSYHPPTDIILIVFIRTPSNKLIPSMTSNKKADRTPTL